MIRLTKPSLPVSGIADRITRIMPTLLHKRDALLAYLNEFTSCIVAFSGGVDSAVVAKAAHLALGEAATAVTANSPSLAASELSDAKRVAQEIGIRHHIVNTHELERSEYARNASDRCYHCKTELYEHLANYAQASGIEVILNGANQDDLGDYRPGLQAATEHDVQSPLIACNCDKQDVRLLADHWQLPVWNKPASPCLSSRVAYGEEVTRERLAMIEQAEQFLKQHGFSNIRVRYHRGDLARVEVPVEHIAQLCDDHLREAFTRHLVELGFKFITLDLQGFRSGSLNTLVPLEILQ